MKKKILIIGDSFSSLNVGWPSMLGQEIVNLSQNGVGEYKIFMQSKRYPLWQFSNIIVCHTSPWRVHTKMHPIHHKNAIRSENDFLLADVEYHSTYNKDMKLVKNYLDKFLDLDYQKKIYELLVNELKKIKNSIHITFHDKTDTDMIENNLNEIWKKNKGDINHMNLTGNRQVADIVKGLLNG